MSKFVFWRSRVNREEEDAELNTLLGSRPQGAPSGNNVTDTSQRDYMTTLEPKYESEDKQLRNIRSSREGEQRQCSFWELLNRMKNSTRDFRMPDSGCQPAAVVASYLSHMISALVSLNSSAGYFLAFHVSCLRKAKSGLAAKIDSPCAYLWPGSSITM